MNLGAWGGPVSTAVRTDVYRTHPGQAGHTVRNITENSPISLTIQHYLSLASTMDTITKEKPLILANLWRISRFLSELSGTVSGCEPTTASWTNNALSPSQLTNSFGEKTKIQKNLKTDIPKFTCQPLCKISTDRMDLEFFAYLDWILRKSVENMGHSAPPESS